jgi:hypothetical protein
VHADFSIAKTQNAQVERQGMMAGNDSAVGVAVRQFFRPSVLALLALAVVFGGFSYGYKLAQYMQHSEVTRATLTRAWLEDRSASVAVVSHAQADPGKLLGLALVAAALLRMAHRTPDIFFDEAAPTREAFHSSSLIPFRAPPISNPSLA